MQDRSILIRVGHSPDPDVAFMFYGLAVEKAAAGTLPHAASRQRTSPILR